MLLLANPSVQNSGKDLINGLKVQAIHGGQSIKKI